MGDFTEFVNTVKAEQADVTRNPERVGQEVKPIMVLDWDGELAHVKSFEFDPENDCWIISLEQ